MRQALCITAIQLYRLLNHLLNNPLSNYKVYTLKIMQVEYAIKFRNDCPSIYYEQVAAR